MNFSHARTGCGGYRFQSGHQRNTDPRSLTVNRGGAAQSWHRLSGKNVSRSGGGARKGSVMIFAAHIIPAAPREGNR